MKILLLTTGSINTEPVQGSLESYMEEGWELELCNYSNNPNEVIVTKALQSLPELIIYFSVAAGPSLPSIETFKVIKDIAPLVHICFDASCPDWHPLLKNYIENECFDLTVNIDGNFTWPQGDKDFTALCPIDPRPYKKMDSNYGRYTSRTVHCGFAGGTGSKDRQEMISYLQQNGAIKVMQRDERYGTYQNYADFSMQCKNILNMSACGSGKARQVKARVLEAGMSHALLLEERGSATKNWFKAGQDYLEYTTKEEALELIEGLMDNEATSYSYAENLHAKVIKHHNANLFWSKVFGLALP